MQYGSPLINPQNQAIYYKSSRYAKFEYDLLTELLEQVEQFIFTYQIHVNKTVSILTMFSFTTAPFAEEVKTTRYELSVRNHAFFAYNLFEYP